MKSVRLMGVVNVTPDSFFDGGFFFRPDDAIDHALKLADEGADILDIGGASSRPGATPISAAEELERILPVVQGVRKHSSLSISIDTTSSLVARATLDHGATMINDISAGTSDAALLKIVADTKVPICLMHMRGNPETMQHNVDYIDLIGEIKTFLADAALRALADGIDREKIMLDPGIGFGKSPEGNLEILQRLDEICALGFPVLVGTSRKSFFGKLLHLPLEERLEPTLATLSFAARKGVSIVRVHDVAAAKRYLDMTNLLENW